MAMTSKQVLLLKAIHVEKGLPPSDLDQILEKIEYETTKQSLQFIIRTLIQKGLVEKCEQVVREGRYRRPLVLTKTGEEILNIYVLSSQKNSKPKSINTPISINDLDFE